MAGFIDVNGNNTYADTVITGVHYPVNSPDLEASIATYKPEYKQRLLDLNKDHDLSYMFVSLCHPKSRGTIRLKSASIWDKPIIRPNYFSHPDDLELMLRIVKEQMAYVNTKSFQKYGGAFVTFPIPECAQFGYESDDYLRCSFKYLSDTDYHPVGSSKMGPDSDPTAVVNPRLQVRNIKGLRQIDAGM